MKKIIVFGAGSIGNNIIKFIGVEKVAFVIDNDQKKQGQQVLGLDIWSLQEAKSKIAEDDIVIISLDEKWHKDIIYQLSNEGIKNYIPYNDYLVSETRRRVLERPDYVQGYKRAILWIKKNSIAGKGIINSTTIPEAYPEVTGYYIPTLLRWGYRELASQYADWLCSIQHESGAWYDTYNKEPYIFDTAQILKGLLAIRTLKAGVEANIIKGCEWLISRVNENGRLVAPNEKIWENGETMSELIHTYCISPLMEAGKVFERSDFTDTANRIIDFYTHNQRKSIVNFHMLSHFYGYVVEAMLDIGRDDLAKEAMANLEKYQKRSGAIPAYNNVDWVCSTGLFQLALVWYRLGNIERGNKAFEYACKLQNESGGWFGSYLSEENEDEKNNYFPAGEISWANKYFLDALYYKNCSQFENQADSFLDKIQENDGRWLIVRNVVSTLNCDAKVLDAGCGKGRYLVNLEKEFPGLDLVGCDLSERVMKYIASDKICKMKGTLTCLPFGDESFDLAYTCEAIEHAVDTERAIEELLRVTKKDGKVVIIDKNINMLGTMEIENWEQWFDEDEIKQYMLRYCSAVEVVKEIDYEGHKSDGLFLAWIGTKR